MVVTLEDVERIRQQEHEQRLRKRLAAAEVAATQATRDDKRSVDAAADELLTAQRLCGAWETEAGVTLTMPIASPIHQVRTSSKYVEASLAPAHTRIPTPANAVNSGNTITPKTNSQNRLRKSRSDVSMRSQLRSTTAAHA